MDIKKNISCEEGFILACKQLKIKSTVLPSNNFLPKNIQKSIIAFYKLIIITKALNNGWKAEYKTYKQTKFWNHLWIDPLGTPHIFTDSTTEYSGAGMCEGTLLCFKDEESAKFAGKNFQKLYEEYLLIK